MSAKNLMGIDPKVAADLGFLRLKYVAVERERRWLCDTVPRNLVLRTEAITDLYVTGTQLRLRKAQPIDGSTPMLRLTRKGDVDEHTRLITSIYLPENEFQVLWASLSGTTISKLRHRLTKQSGATLLVDEFQDKLDGLILAEAEFDTPEQLAAFGMPDFAVREVTGELQYTGGSLVSNDGPNF